MFLCIETSGYFPDIPMSSFQLMVAAGALLMVAAVLLGLRRRTSNVAVQRSLLTDELMIYLGRIADALAGRDDFEIQLPPPGEASGPR